MGVYGGAATGAAMWMRRAWTKVPLEVPCSRPMTRILNSPDAVATAAEVLRAGGVVVLPTETVYGLAGMTRCEAALDQIYTLKGRPADNPLIAHVSSIDMARSCVGVWTPQADSVAEAFWPGPLTIILPKAEDIPGRAVAGHATIALRWPDHPIAQALVEAVGSPLSAPSANRSGQISPTTAAHVASDYASVDAAAELLILDGGPCRRGIESTVLDLCGSVPRILRPGAVSREDIEGVLGSVSGDDAPMQQSASPGTRSRHYAPGTPVTVFPAGTAPDLTGASACVVISISAPRCESPHAHFRLPSDPEAAAGVFYNADLEA